ncbi:MAG: M56 family metallopeptidase [Acidimicrobiales bacterium]
MNGPVVGLGFFAVLVGLSVLVGRQVGTSPRVAAGAYVVSLLGWALLPAVWLACLGGSLGWWLGGMRTAGGGCLLALNRSQWQLVGYLPGAAAFGLLVSHVVRLAVLTRRVEIRGLALSSSIRRPTSAGAVWVVPSREPAAFAAGLWHPRAIVTSGLLAAVERGERQAICEHEAAHVRLGHPRLLVICGAVAAMYGRFPPVQRAWEGLRRELEAAADDEAARVVGTKVLVLALIRVAVLLGCDTPDLAAGFMGLESLLWRIARLENHGRSTPRSTAVVGVTAIAVISSMSIIVCVLGGIAAGAVGVSVCLLGLILVATRPLWEGLHRHSFGC